jgi:O-antigen chain-terminating methyltransferase
VNIKKLSNLPGFEKIYEYMSFIINIPKMQRTLFCLLEDSKNTEIKFESISKRNEENYDKITHLSEKIRMLEKTNLSKNDDKRRKSLADNHILDKFYLSFENIFRGNEEDILNRLKFYVKYIDEVKQNHDKKVRVLDIGCGRGEFLKLVEKNGCSAIGIDLNSAMIEDTKSRGYESHEVDALSYLLECKDGSLDVISGFHIVEHIPFDELIMIFQECYRVLTNNGVVIFETPNPENVTVGSNRFYLDPSHLKPIPPELLSYSLQFSGFRNIETNRLNPEISTVKKLTNSFDLDKKLFGPQDYSIIARKI